MPTLPRREFLKTSLVASAATALAHAPLGAADKNESSSAREYYELRAYRLKPDVSTALLEAYLEKALIPALNRRGLASIGVFAEETPKDGPAIWVFIPHPTLESFVQVSADLNTDAAVMAAGADYLQVPKASPAYERVDTWLLRAFASMPKLEQPAFSRERQPGRIFEMRHYESYSEQKALKKMAMFDDGETEIMRDVKLSPVFFGQALAGPNLPHLTYMTSAPSLEVHKANWDAFRKHPKWEKMRTDPQYADTVSKNTARFLTPKPYSQI